MRRLLPDRISAQLFLLVLGAVVLANLLAAAVFLLARNSAQHHNPAETTGRLAAMIETLDAAPSSERPDLLAAFRRAHPDLSIAAGGVMPGQFTQPAPYNHLARALGPRFEVQSGLSGGNGGAQQHVVRLADGTILSASEPPMPPRPFLGPQTVSLLVAGLSLLALLVWSARKITRPLQTITQAAERFRPEVNPPLIPEKGPYEIRALAQAFNAMQQRIGELLTEKTNALAAVSHDLRTPITRMRLRAEFMSDTAERARMIHDLDQMDQMTQSALDHLRAVSQGTDREPVDLASLLHTLADRFQDQGQPVEVVSAPRLVARIRPLDVERALENLIENACKYATPPTLRLYDKGGEAIIEIEDRGPGIPAARREELLQPFTRGDHARGMNDVGGFGLGLAIAREATLRQGGRLWLLDAEPHGLVVRLSLPLSA